MPKLTRYLQKIFANNSNEVGVFGTGADKETSKNVETLQSSDYEEGWSSAIITNKNYPIWQEMDGVQYGLSYQLKYLFQNGIPEWLSTETYYENAYCRVGSTIYYSLQDNNTNHSPSLNNGWWTPLLTSNRSIGEIIPSCVPLTEAGLHLLDGALISNGIYSDFITYIGGLSATYPDLFCTEQEWQASVTTYGVCGKFVYNSTNNTVRLPKITGIVEGTTGLTALGDLVEAGLPNITGTWRVNGTDKGSSATGAFNGGRIQATGAGYGHESSVSNGYQGFTFNASLSSSIYGNSNTVQPQTIKVLYYIVVATSTKTDIQVDIDEIATELNTCLDTKRYDGQWVDSSLELQNTATAGTYTLDLSEYLPQDGYNYEILTKIALINSVSGTNAYLQVSSDIITGQYITVGSDQNLGGVWQINCSILPARSYIESIISDNVTESYIHLYGYRRIGTNS